MMERCPTEYYNRGQIMIQYLDVCMQISLSACQVEIESGAFYLLMLMKVGNLYLNILLASRSWYVGLRYKYAARSLWQCLELRA